MSFENPNESKRVDDAAKAQEMAQQSDSEHTRAAEERRKLNEPYVPELKKEFSDKAKFWDKKAEQKEREAAIDYEVGKETQDMGEGELQAALEKANADEKVAEQLVYSLRQQGAEKEKLESAEAAWSQLSRRRFALEKIISSRR
jgi:signal recognition particle GTPase